MPVFRSYQLWYIDLLFEVRFYFVSEHLPDAPDKFVRIVPKGIVMSPIFRSLSIIINLDRGVVFNNIVSCVHKGIA